LYCFGEVRNSKKEKKKVYRKGELDISAHIGWGGGKGDTSAHVG
jgi:hypothetical protein